MKNEDPYLKIIKQSRPRESMPRPVVFKDKKKYDRKRSKMELLEEIEDGVLDSEGTDEYPEDQQSNSL